MHNDSERRLRSLSWRSLLQNTERSTDGEETRKKGKERRDKHKYKKPTQRREDSSEGVTTIAHTTCRTVGGRYTRNGAGAK